MRYFLVVDDDGDDDDDYELWLLLLSWSFSWSWLTMMSIIMTQQHQSNIKHHTSTITTTIRLSHDPLFQDRLCDPAAASSLAAAALHGDASPKVLTVAAAVLTASQVLPSDLGWFIQVGNEGPSTFTAWYIGDETEASFPTKGQLVQGTAIWIFQGGTLPETNSL